MLLSGPVGISISMPGQIRDADGHNALHGKAGSALRGKTGLFVSSQNFVFVSVPHSVNSPAKILVIGMQWVERFDGLGE